MRCRIRLLTATGIALALALAVPADAGAKNKAKAAATAGHKAAPRAQPKEAKDPPPLPPPQGKLVVFPFAGVWIKFPHLSLSIAIFDPVALRM